MSTPSRTFSTPLGTLRVTQQTPFLFNSADIPPMPPQTPFPKYDPDQFQAKNFGFGPVQPNFGGSSLFAEDVDMDSPAKPERTPKSRVEQHPTEQEAHTAPATLDNLPGPDSKQDVKTGMGVGLGHSSNGEEKAENRVYATGGVKRELNKRARKRQQREQVSRHICCLHRCRTLKGSGAGRSKTPREEYQLSSSSGRTFPAAFRDPSSASWVSGIMGVEKVPTGQIHPGVRQCLDGPCRAVLFRAIRPDCPERRQRSHAGGICG